MGQPDSSTSRFQRFEEAKGKGFNLWVPSRCSHPFLFNSLGARSKCLSFTLSFASSVTFSPDACIIMLLCVCKQINKYTKLRDPALLNGHLRIQKMPLCVCVYLFPLDAHESRLLAYLRAKMSPQTLRTSQTQNNRCAIFKENYLRGRGALLTSRPLS